MKALAEALDRQATFSGTMPVTPALAFDEGALAEWLRGRIGSWSGRLRVSQFKGGQSNPTYLVDAGRAAYVLRRKPPGTLLPSAHAVEREYRVMDALAAEGFPVPRPVALEEDPDVIGTAFFVMEFKRGRVFWEPHAPGLARDERTALFDSLNRTLARLHQFDLAELGLADFGRGDGYVARQVARWSKQYRASATEPIAAMDALIEWLPGNVPAETRTTIVHGDYRLDNCIVDPTEPEIIAVLDWELSTLGDPIADLTYHLMQWRMPRAESGAGVGTLAGLDLDTLGIPSIEAYVAQYQARTGGSALSDLDVYFAYNFFRLAAIFQGIVGRVRDGTASNANAATVASLVRPLAETAHAHARRAGL